MSTPEPLSTEELEAIRAREQAATEGPWRAWDRGVGYLIAVGDELDSGGRPVRFLPEGMRTDIGRLEDAEFAAHAREDVPRLLADVERCLTAEDVERFLKRERDEYEPHGECWNTVDDVLDAFRLHVVTGTPLTEPRPSGGPEAVDE